MIYFIEDFEIHVLTWVSQTSCGPDRAGVIGSISQMKNKGSGGLEPGTSDSSSTQATLSIVANVGPSKVLSGRIKKKGMWVTSSNSCFPISPAAVTAHIKLQLISTRG